VKESEMMDVGESKLDDGATAAGNTEDSSEGFFTSFCIILCICHTTYHTSLS